MNDNTSWAILFISVAAVFIALFYFESQPEPVDPAVSKCVENNGIPVYTDGWTGRIMTDCKIYK